jgi:hypothetical protein
MISAWNRDESAMRRHAAASAPNRPWYCSVSVLSIPRMDE